MDAHTLLAEWETSPFDGGFAGLADLQSRRFSGVVETGTTRLFLRDGDPVAVVADVEESPHEGDVDAFDGASGETYEAPHPAAVTLAAMLTLDGEVRGQYFTDDTPLSTVHETLADGGFTGYVELSENVLSGDYYVVYEDGEASYLGVLGSSNRLITDEEAESKAESEVGIYSVVAVPLPEVELPEPAPDSSDSTATGVAGGATDEHGDDPAADDGANAPEGEPEPEVTPEPVEEETPTDETPTDETADPPVGDDAAGAAAPANADAGERGTATEAGTPAPDSGGAAGGDPDDQSESGRAVEASADSAATTGGTNADDDVGTSQVSSEGDAPNPAPSTTSEGRSNDPVMDDVTTRSVPSLDPENTWRDGAEPSRNASASQQETQSGSRAADEERERPSPGTVEGLQERYESKIAELQAELNELRNERDDLRERVTSLESSANSVASGRGGETALAPATALDGTSLFVREGSRGGATLEDAHAGRTDREELAENLRIEHHTTFDADGATVDGEPFEAWLESSVPYAFAEWLVTDLLFEIRSTGSRSSMRHLYDALPELDRVGFADTVTVGDGKDGRELSFDVVARNRMGDPIAVANIDDQREPTQSDRLEPIIDDASDICMEYDSLTGAFAVTSSYFEPGALSAAREATSGSLLSREKYRSYVKLSRTNGFHLCLVESRDGSFHLTVPEL